MTRYSIDILDFLFQKARCDGLSELRTPVINFRLKIILCKSDFMKFSLEDWEYAYCYIFNAPSGANTIDQLHHQFMAALSSGCQRGNQPT